MKAGVRLYHPWVHFGHCRGLGTCGTCAVRIEGSVSEMTSIERWRLSFPPHSHQNDLRLACQCKVEGDLAIEKFPGIWGQRAEQNPVSMD
ncbi:MAG: 2Fe-2S iron-sulfur cluster-binding protein [Pirellulaceae bacterium]